MFHLSLYRLRTVIWWDSNGFYNVRNVAVEKLHETHMQWYTGALLNWAEVRRQGAKSLIDEKVSKIKRTAIQSLTGSEVFEPVSVADIAKRAVALFFVVY